MSGYRAVDAAGLALCDAALYGIFLPVKIAEKVGIPALFPGLTESQRTAAEGKHRDYSLTGPETKASVKRGLANGQWFLPHIERKTLRRLMQRDDYHATRDTLALFGLICGSGYAAYHFWSEGSYGMFALSFWIYCTLYTSSGDSRWHECGHGTAFKTKWMNDVLYEVASFMVFREPLVWRFSHARHHTDTDIAGRDPEMDGRPLDMWNLFIAFFNVQGIQGESKKIWMHANGSLSHREGVRPVDVPLPRVLAGAQLAGVLFPHRPRLGLLPQPAAGDVRLPALLARRVALRAYWGVPARVARPRRARSPAQHTHLLYQPDQRLHLLEYALPRGASHVPDGAVL